MGVSAGNSMREPGLDYLKWRAIGVPAATVSLVTNGIFRGRGDTTTPLLCGVLGLAVNLVLDPLLIFTAKMGCGGAGAATAISQWVSLVPLVYLLNKSVRIRIFNRNKNFFKNALSSYINAGMS